MKRVNKGFSGRETPLFSTMMASSTSQTDSGVEPTTTEPTVSTSQIEQSSNPSTVISSEQQTVTQVTIPIPPSKRRRLVKKSPSLQTPISPTQQTTLDPTSRQEDSTQDTQGDLVLPPKKVPIKELEGNVTKAATTVATTVAQDSSNINKTKVTATVGVQTSTGPRCQETMRLVDVQSRIDATRTSSSYEPPKSGTQTGRREESFHYNNLELMELVASLISETRKYAEQVKGYEAEIQTLREDVEILKDEVWHLKFNRGQTKVKVEHSPVSVQIHSSPIDVDDSIDANKKGENESDDESKGKLEDEKIDLDVGNLVLDFDAEKKKDSSEEAHGTSSELEEAQIGFVFHDYFVRFEILEDDWVMVNVKEAEVIEVRSIGIQTVEEVENVEKEFELLDLMVSSEELMDSLFPKVSTVVPSTVVVTTATVLSTTVDTSTAATVTASTALEIPTTVGSSAVATSITNTQSLVNPSAISIIPSEAVSTLLSMGETSSFHAVMTESVIVSSVTSISPSSAVNTDELLQAAEILRQEEERIQEEKRLKAEAEKKKKMEEDKRKREIAKSVERQKQKESMIKKAQKVPTQRSTISLKEPDVIPKAPLPTKDKGKSVSLKENEEAERKEEAKREREAIEEAKAVKWKKEYLDPKTAEEEHSKVKDKDVSSDVQIEMDEDYARQLAEEISLADLANLKQIEEDTRLAKELYQKETEERKNLESSQKKKNPRSGKKFKSEKEKEDRKKFISYLITFGHNPKSLGPMKTSNLMDLYAEVKKKNKEKESAERIEVERIMKQRYDVQYTSKKRKNEAEQSQTKKLKTAQTAETVRTSVVSTTASTVVSSISTVTSAATPVVVTAASTVNVSTAESTAGSSEVGTSSKSHEFNLEQIKKDCKDLVEHHQVIYTVPLDIKASIIHWETVRRIDKIWYQVTRSDKSKFLYPNTDKLFMAMDRHDLLDMLNISNRMYTVRGDNELAGYNNIIHLKLRALHFVKEAEKVHKIARVKEWFLMEKSQTYMIKWDTGEYSVHFVEREYNLSYETLRQLKNCKLKCDTSTELSWKLIWSVTCRINYFESTSDEEKQKWMDALERTLNS